MDVSVVGNTRAPWERLLVEVIRLNSDTNNELDPSAVNRIRGPGCISPPTSSASNVYRQSEIGD